MPVQAVVGIHPHKAARLAVALLTCSHELYVVALDTLVACTEAMVDPDPLGHVLDSTDWLDEQARRLQAILDELFQPIAAGARLHVDGTQIWQAPYGQAHDDPIEAMAAAHEAQVLVRALHDGGDPEDLAALSSLVERWHDDAVFAGVIAAGFTPADVVLLLRRRDEAHGAAPDDRDTATAATAIDGLFAVMGTASLFETLPWRFDDLTRELSLDYGHGGAAGDGDDVGLPRPARALAALLFAPGSVWHAQVLIDATRQIVLPANQHARDRHAPQSTAHGHDTRAAVLSAVARNPIAAQAVLRDLPLDELLSTANAYDDGGRALGEVLVAATAPGFENAEHAMRQLIDWTVTHADLPPLAHARLGAVITPYLGAFRTVAFDGDESIHNPLPAIDGTARRRFLEYAAEDERALVELRTAELRWARDRLLAVGGAAYDGSGIGVVASVDSQVAGAVSAGLLDQLRDADARDEARRGFWVFLATTIAGSIQPPAVGGFAALATDQVLDRGLPRPDKANAHAERAMAQARTEEAMFENLVMASLWEHRAVNRVFDEVPLPIELLEGEPPRMKALVGLSDDEYERYAQWKQDPRVKAATRWQELAVWGQR